MKKGAIEGRSKPHETQQRVLDLLKAGALGAKDLASVLNLRLPHLKRVLRALEDSGRVAAFEDEIGWDDEDEWVTKYRFVADLPKSEYSQERLKYFREYSREYRARK